MKPILYPETETEFANNGYGILTDAISCKVTKALNGMYELEMKYPVKGIHYGYIAQRGIIFALAGRTEGKQPFRIYRITRPIGGIVTVYARQVAYDMMGIPVSPFTAKSANEAFADMKANAATDCPFEFYTDVTTESQMTVAVPTALWSLLGGTEGSILDCYGGEYEFDRWTVRLHSRRGENRGVSIRYGKNLTDLEQDENCAGCYTGVYPYWQNADGDYMELPEKIVKAAGTYSYSNALSLDLSQEWEKMPTEAQLRARAKKYITDNDIGTPAVSWKIEFVQLEQTEEYKGKAMLERVDMGDTVTVEFAEMGISASARVVQACYDSILERHDSVTLGKVKASFADIVVNTQKEVEKKPSSKAMGLTIQTLTAGILGAKGGCVRFLDDDGDGMQDTLYIADKADPDTATKVWRLNFEGWGGSQNGYNGPFKIGATIGGGFIAGWITTGKLSSADGKSYFDLDAGKIVTNNITATGGTIGGCSIINGKLQVPAAQITGTLTASQIDATNLKVSAANITGTLTVKNASGNTLLSAGGNAVAIAGFKVDSNSLYSGDSFATAECFLCTGSSSTFNIGGSGSISGWMIKAGSSFGVTKAGAVYANAGKIAGWNIGSVTMKTPTGATLYSGQAMYGSYTLKGYTYTVALTPTQVFMNVSDANGVTSAMSAYWGDIVNKANT